MAKLQVKGPELTGAVLVTLGLLVVLQWLFDIDAIARLIPGAAQMGLVNPILLVATGLTLTLLARDAERPWRRRVAVACVVALIVVPMAYLVETVADIDLGIDLVRGSTKATASYPHPGRISPNASLAFLLTGAALWLRLQPSTNLRQWLYAVCALAVSAIGIGGLVGYLVGFEGLYQVGAFNRMLPGTAFGMSIAAAGLWMLGRAVEAVDSNALEKSERRIAYRSLAVLGLVTLGAGVAGFSLLRETFEDTVSRNMLLSATTNAKSLGNTIELSLWFPRTASTRPPIRKALKTLSELPDDLEAKQLLATVAQTFLPLGVAGLEFRDAKGVLVASAGELNLPKAQVHHRLATKGLDAVLAWKNGYLLATEIDVVVDGRIVGHVVAEQRLTLFDSILADVQSSNDSMDAAICGREGDKAVLAPNPTRPETFEVPMFNSNGDVTLPVVQALLGQRGAEFFKDQRGINVLSAYAPINDYGIAFVINRDVYSLYAPLRSRLSILWLALAGIIGLGMYALRDQVRPLLRQLAESQSRLKAILEDQLELVSLTRPDGTLTYVNPAYARQFNRAPPEMLGTSMYDYVEPAHRDEVRRHFAGLVANGKAVCGENRMLSAEGHECWFSWTNSLQHSKEGLLIHSVGREVTARKQAETALLNSQSLLARTGRVAGVGGWQLDLVSGELNWSEETRRIHDVAPDFKPTLESAIQFYAPEARVAIDAAVKTAIAEGTVWDLELPFMTATGRPIWVRAQGEAEFDGEVPVRLVGAFQDITERKLLQRRLSDNERFLRKITDSLPVRIAYVDREARFQFVNLAHCKRFGLERENILGRRRGELTTGSTDADVAAQLRAALDGREQCFEFDEVVQGKPRRIESRLIPDIGEDGSIQGLFTTGIDITERARAEQALRELTVIFDNTTDLVVQTDSRGDILYMNPAARAFVGLQSGESKEGTGFKEFTTPQTNLQFGNVILPAVRANGIWVGETTVYGADKQVVPVSHMVIAHRNSSERICRYSAILRDISPQAAAKAESDRQTATLQSVSEAIPAIVAVIGANGRYRFVNSAFERWCGSKRAAVVGRTVMEVLGMSEHDRDGPWMKRALAGESVSFEREYADRGDARFLAHSYIPLQLASGDIDGFVSVAQDISRHKEEELRLLQLAQRDPLTGLLNRAGFEKYIEARAQEDAGAGMRTTALLYIDLDHFKPVNDAHGHLVGDQLLQMFAKRLQRTVRPSDAVARLGGDEFAIALAGVGRVENAHAVAEKIVCAAGDPFKIGALTLNVGASIGVAFGGEQDTGWQELLTCADARLYEAKAAGRGRFAGTVAGPISATSWR